MVCQSAGRGAGEGTAGPIPWKSVWGRDADPAFAPDHGRLGLMTLQ